ncbi:MAG: DegT/DnrJ/EryC1/StrS family aminotransferase [Chthonomonadales bacterium]|nr:DegT/DnrJ/EryC1/StrS family aminotransferase [Chthonomonadales bacterium]
MPLDLDDLAVFGGTPAFAEPLHVGRPNIGDRERLHARIDEMLDRRWLSNNGPFVRELEQRIADMVGVRHCIAMCNATIALEIAIRAAGLTGEVIVPSFTFVATAHALQWQEVTPVFCDVDPETHNLDPARVEALITPRTAGIIGVHVWGRPCAVDRLAEIADRRGLSLLFDAAHAFGCSHGGRMIGGFGLAEVFSFHATKFLNTFEGGAVVTNDDDLARRIRLMKNFGFAGYDSVIYIGTNGKMTEATAAMGLTSLESMESFVDVNRRNYRAYQAELAGARGLRMVTYDEAERCNYQYIVVEVDGGTLGLSRDALVQVLHAENVLARRYFFPGCHQMEPYRSYFPHAGLLLPETARIAERVLILPTGTAVGCPEIERIAAIVRLCAARGGEVTRRLAESA